MRNSKETFNCLFQSRDFWYFTVTFVCLWYVFHPFRSIKTRHCQLGIGRNDLTLITHFFFFFKKRCLQYNAVWGWEWLWLLYWTVIPKLGIKVNNESIHVKANTLIMSLQANSSISQLVLHGLCQRVSKSIAMLQFQLQFQQSWDAVEKCVKAMICKH